MTQPDVATFTADERESSSAVGRLAEIGFAFGPPHPVSRSLLDTFDGRLQRAGLRLELRESDDLELILSGDGSARAQLAVSSVPRFPDELPPGPFRDRLAVITDVRALLPVLRVTALRSAGIRHDRAGKIVATADLYEDVRVDGGDRVAWAIEIDELAGYPKQATKARAALSDLGLSRTDGDTLSVVAAKSGVNLTGAAGPTGVLLDPEMPAIVGFRSVLAELGDSILANWQGTIERTDPEFLHDLRVAVRRTRSVVGEGKKVLPRAIAERAEERFGWLGSATGRARDLDVHLINWTADTRPLGDAVVAALEPVHLLVKQRNEAAHTTLARVLQSAEAAELMATAANWWRAPALEDDAGKDAERPLGKIVTKRIARAHANLIARGRAINPDSPAEQVHDLRKDAKKLRYLLECFAGLLDDSPRKAFVRRLKAFQDNLGEHHDAAVHVAELRAISHELHWGFASSDTMLAIGQLISQIDQRRIATRLEFAEHFAAYDTKATQRDLDAALPRATR